MAAYLLKIIGLVSLLIASLTACAINSKPYAPPALSATATLIYDIAAESYIDPYNGSQRGYTERVDIQVKPSRFTQPQTVYMQFADGRSIREINHYEANKPLLFYYEHRSVKDLGHWPIWCIADVNVTLMPDTDYILKGKTIGTYKDRRFFKSQKVLESQCQRQIINAKTQEVVADSNMENLMH